MASLLQKISGSVLRTGLTWMSKRRFPQVEGSFRLKGLEGEVEVRRDPEGVPYIKAGSRHDLFYAQGFAHTQDRLWQMEMNRRLAAGRLAELFGEGALATDRLSRTFGFARMAQEDWKLLSPEMQAYLQSYCDGVNACLEHLGKKLPVEFKLTGHTPEPWKPVDALAFTRLLTLQLAHGWGHELARAELLRSMDPELAAELDIRYHHENPVTLPDGVGIRAWDADGNLQALDGPYLREMGGSNAWALDGRMTDTGKPYLCADPHLSLLMPSIWYQVYLEAPDLRSQGVSIPGIPLVLIGHNAHIGWGVTLAFSDIQDVFIEEFESPGSTAYRYRDEWLQATVAEEVIRIKGAAQPHTERVMYTRNGPVISDVLPEGGPEAHPHRLSLNSPALRPGPFSMGWYGLNVAEGWDDFVDAARHIQAPGLNLVYGDVDGNIGYWMTGETPIRAKGQGEVPQPAWTGEYDWVGQVPFAEMPHVLNPERGYVVSANNKVVGDDFPHFMGNLWMNGYRARRIEELLLEKKVWKRDDFPAIQNDLFCRPGVELALHFSGIKGATELEEAARKYLVEWDGFLTTETIGGTIYKVCRGVLLEQLYAAGAASDTGYGWLRGKGADPIMLRVSEYKGKDTVALLHLLDDPGSKLLAKAGGKEALLKAALAETVAYLTKEWGKRPGQWKWGRLHQVTFRHAMAVKSPLDRVFNPRLRPIGGDTDTVCQTSIHPEEPYHANLACPSYRQILDFSDFGNSLWIKPPGQSGHLGHPNREDQIEPWLEGKYFPMCWHPDQIRSYANKRMLLLPLKA